MIADASAPSGRVNAGAITSLITVLSSRVALVPPVSMLSEIWLKMLSRDAESEAER